MSWVANLYGLDFVNTWVTFFAPTDAGAVGLLEQLGTEVFVAAKSIVVIWRDPLASERFGSSSCPFVGLPQHIFRLVAFPGL